MTTINKAVRFRTSNRDNMRKWVEALESGQYQQVDGSLRKAKRDGGGAFVQPPQYGYCCLGVACEIAKPDLPRLHDAITTVWEGHTDRWDPEGSGGHKVEVLDDFEYGEPGDDDHEQGGSHLLKPVWEWLGVPSENPVVGYKVSKDWQDREAVEPVIATGANDEEHWSFTQIAEWLRYVYMVGWTDAQVQEAARYEYEQGRVSSARNILAMINKSVEAPAADYDVPEAPSELPDTTLFNTQSEEERASDDDDDE